MRYKPALAGLLAAIVLTVLSGCGNGDPTPTISADISVPSYDVASFPAEPIPLPTTEVPEEVHLLQISTPEEIQAELYEAIRSVRQPMPMEISGVTWQYTPEIDIKNLYYNVIGQYPELKYAYDVSAVAGEDLLICQVSYMPYMTGEYPEEEDYLSVSSFEELLAVAEEHLGGEAVAIRITDRTWTPDEVNHALSQVGGGYILCSLNRDGTKITYAPAMEMDMEECLAALEETERLANKLLSELVTDDMTQAEKAFAIYSYLTSNVKYDQRYYSDIEHMPYQSRTALGALQDGTAICGGFSNAVKILFEKMGIPCYTVSGSYIQENHMWNIACLDGEWRWFDATIDRGNTGEYGFLRFALEDLDTTKYRWDQNSIAMLLE